MINILIVIIIMIMDFRRRLESSASPRALFAAYGQSPYRTKVLNFRGFDSSRILTLGVGVLMSTGNSKFLFPESFESTDLSRDN